MIEQNQVRPIRKVAIADHLWEALDQMAKEMGTDRDGLVNQALFMFARLNGYLTPSGVAASVSPAPAARAQSPSSRQVAAPQDGAPMPSPSRVRMAAEPAPAPKAAPAEPPPEMSAGEEDSERREVRERVFETAAELERLIKGGRGDGAPAGGRQQEVSEVSAPGANGEKALYLMAEDGELDKVTKDRFLIGRGKHCDFIINSGKVSREHAAIARDGTEYFIEDLGSSNGTWFNKQRIKRRKIEDGDEYYICSEKIKCVIR
jgi:hypothetical protein